MKKKVFKITSVSLILVFIALFIGSIISLWPKIQKYIDISYGNFDTQKIDIYLPDRIDRIDNKSLDLMLFIHGGDWNSGDKSYYTNSCKELSKQLYIISATMNYRLISDGATSVDMLNDIYSALSIIKIQIENLGLTINNIALMGNTAGAHLALLYSYQYGNSPEFPISFCVAQSTLIDFNDLDIYNQDIWGNYLLTIASHLSGEEITNDNLHLMSTALNKISPYFYINDNPPPTLIAHGTLDNIFPISQAKKLQQTLNNKGVPIDLFEHTKSSHTLIDDKTTNELFLQKLLEYTKKYFTSTISK